MPSHGGFQFDEFHARPSLPHNGAQADEGYGHRGAEPHGGQTYDEFGSSPAGPLNMRHGARWDDFPWDGMPPAAHGTHFDQDFGGPAYLNDGTGHGTWHDVFRGAQVKLIVDGRDVEASVENTRDNYGVAVTAQGQRVEFGLGQVTAFRRQGAPSRDGQRTAQSGDMGVGTGPGASAAQRGSQDAANANGGRRSLAVKTADDELDVAKSGPKVAYGVAQGKGRMRTFIGPYCRGCAHEAAPNLTSSTVLKHMVKAERPAMGCINCGAKVKSSIAKTADDVVDVRKDVDATETATQGDASAATIGRRANCPEKGNSRCGVAEKGRCSVCGTSVHEAASKSFADVLDVLDVLKARG